MSKPSTSALSPAMASQTVLPDAGKAAAQPPGSRRKHLTAKDRILAGALVALGQRGLQKVSIEDICHASKTSRRTIYRHFDGRDEIIASVARHISEQFELELEQAIRAKPDLHDRVRVVVEQLITYSEVHQATARLAASEIEFMRDNMAQSFSGYVEMIRKTLEPIFVAEPRLVDAGLSDRSLAELIVRIAMQALLLPVGSQKNVVDTFSAYWQLAVNGALATVT